jgi:hypothetical protein
MNGRKNLFKRIGATAALTAAAVVTASIVAAAPASAASGVLTICSRGNYTSSVEFLNRGGFSSRLVPSGTCRSMNVGYSTGVETIRVFGHVGHAQWLVAQAQLRPSRGGSVTTYGTPQNSWASVPRI